MTPEQAKATAALLIEVWDGESKGTTQVLAAVGAGNRDYKPDAKSRTAWQIATHMLAFEGDSRVVWFEGNYQDYEADRRRRLGAEADTPHRIKYRKLTR